MGSRVYFAVMMVLSIYIVKSLAFPRDSSAFQREHNGLSNDYAVITQKTETAYSTVAEPKIPGRITCQYEEATEDDICQEHCLPKGYSYGLCVSKTCSCI